MNVASSNVTCVSKSKLLSGNTRSVLLITITCSLSWTAPCTTSLNIGGLANTFWRCAVDVAHFFQATWSADFCLSSYGRNGTTHPWTQSFNGSHCLYHLPSESQYAMVCKCRSNGCGAQFAKAWYLTQHQLQCFHYKLHQAALAKKKQEKTWKLASEQSIDSAHLDVIGFSLMTWNLDKIDNWHRVILWFWNRQNWILIW